MIEVTISEAVPSLNVTLKEHWSNKTRRRNKFQVQIGQQLILNYKSTARLRAMDKLKREVTIHSQRMRTLDQDNLTGGAKSLIDALKKLGLIVDDTPTWVDVTYTQDKGKPYYTKITIH